MTVSPPPPCTRLRPALDTLMLGLTMTFLSDPRAAVGEESSDG